MTIPVVTISEPLRAERDGCDCPPWVVRCAHLTDGNVLSLADYTVYQCPCSKVMVEEGWTRIKFAVTDEANGEPCPEDARFRHSPQHLRIYVGNDYERALAAFYEAEQNLLRGAE